MSERVTAAILSLLLVVLLCPSETGAEERAAARVVDTEGIAAVIDGDQARARRDAVRNALQNAVEQVAEPWLPPPHIASPDRIVREILLDRAEAYTLDFRILSESLSAGVYRVAVRVTVSETGLRLALNRLRWDEAERSGEAGERRIVLKVLGMSDYGDYLRCQGLLRGQVPGLRRFTLREARWGMARFDIDADGTTQTLAMSLRQTEAFEILHQDIQRLEVYLR